MAIYVDRLRDYKWRLGPSCHLFCDPGNLEELHAFARKLGMRRKWFQTDGDMPHYDLVSGRRLSALLYGAQELTNRETVDRMIAWREHAVAA